MELLVSVIMTAYNSEKYIGAAIESILCQTYQNIELLIVEDCSTDGTLAEIEKFQDQRIHIIKNRKNLGTLCSMRKAVKAAKGEYIAVLDSDDISMPQRIERQVALLDQRPEVFLCGTKARNCINNRITKRKYPPVMGAEQLKFSLIFGNDMIVHSTVMFRRNTLEKKNIQYEKFGYCHDYHLILCVALVSPIYMIEDELVIYRVHKKQKTNILPLEKRQYEAFHALKLYIRELNGLKEYEKRILYKGIKGEVHSLQEFIVLKKVVLKYATNCGLSLEKDSEIIDYELQRLYMCQNQDFKWHIYYFIIKNFFR